jgi:serine/threonine-protein kinase
MLQAEVDRDLLFGAIAVRTNFVTSEELDAALRVRATDSATPLVQVLSARQAIDPDTYALLEALVTKHLARHGGDPRRSLAAVNSVGPVGDVTPCPAPAPASDPYATGAGVAATAADHGVTGPPVADSTRAPAEATEPRAPTSGDDPFATTSPSALAPRSAAPEPAAAGGLRFRVLRPHARGGLGEVFLARDQELGREVALKEIQSRFADQAESRARFLLEAEVTGGLEHPGIVPVYGLGAYPDGRPFYAMRFIKGESLQQAIDRFHRADGPGADPGARGPELRQLLGRFVAVCNAIAYAHSRGVLHRDLKPANIMLGSYGETLVVDWGLAKPTGRPDQAAGPASSALRAASASGTTDTRAGTSVGTPAFMSPEQAAGRLDAVGPASDIYSLGATLYCLLTGRASVGGGDLQSILRQVQRAEWEPPRQVKPDVPAALEAICVKAMALRPEDRYPSAEALAADVEQWLADEPVSAWREPWTVKARRWVNRHRTLVTGAASAGLVAVVCLSAATVLLTAANAREHQARTEAEDNYRLARRAVDRYHTAVSEEVLLNEPGMQPLRKQLLEAAKEFYDEFVRKHEQDPTLKAEQGKALFRLARITGEIGSEVEAIRLHDQARGVLAPLAAAAPADLELQSDLAGCWYQLGRLYRRTDELTKAEAAYQQALAIWTKLVRECPRPDFDRYRAELARSQFGLASVSHAGRRLQKAQEFYELAQRTREQLLADHPGVPAYKRDVAVTHSNLALVYAALGKEAPKAKAAYDAAVAKQEELVRDFPRVSQYQNDLARSHFERGDFFFASGNRDEAEAEYKRSLAAWAELAHNHPTVKDFRINLAEAHAALAATYAANPKRAREAEDACRKAIELKQKLADDDPENASLRGDLARGYIRLGDVYRSAGRNGPAEATYRQALELLDRLTRDRPDVPQYQGDLARAHDKLGFVFEDRHQADKDEGALRQAEEAYGKALRLWDQLARGFPDELEYAVNLSGTANNLANLLCRTGNPAGALAWYDRGIDALNGLPAEQREQKGVKLALRKAHWKRAEALTELGRHADALADWDKTLLFGGTEDQSLARLYRATTLARVGKHAQAAEAAEELTGKVGSSGEGFYRLAAVLALAAKAAAADGTRPEAEREALVNRYTLQALGLLEKGQAAAKSPIDLKRLRADPDFEFLRQGAEFRHRFGDPTLLPNSPADMTASQSAPPNPSLTVMPVLRRPEDAFPPRSVDPNESLVTIVPTETAPRAPAAGPWHRKGIPCECLSSPSRQPPFAPRARSGRSNRHRHRPPTRRGRHRPPTRRGRRRPTTSSPRRRQNAVSLPPAPTRA